MRYEILRTETDPFDMMCGDCEMHEIEYWEEISLDELHQHHIECVEADKNTPDFAKEEYEAMFGDKWEDTPEDFEEFLKSAISSGYIREKEVA